MAAFQEVNMKRILALAAAFAFLPVLLSFMACSGYSPAGSDQGVSDGGSALEELPVEESSDLSSSVPDSQSSSSPPVSSAVTESSSLQGVSSATPPKQSSSSVLLEQSSSSVTPQQSSSSEPPQQSSSSEPPKQSSSSVILQQSSSSVLPGDFSPRDSVNMKFKNCYERNKAAPLNKPALLKEGAEDLPLAYLYHEGDKYQLMIPKVYDYCGFEKVIMDVGRSGDTLKLDIVAMLPTACLCTSDHWFDIEARDADVKYFAVKLYNKSLEVYEVVPGPAPEE